MEKIINDNFILTYFFGKNQKRLNKSLLYDIPNDILEYLNKRYSDSSCILETLERIKKNIDIHPICESCGKPVKYVGSTRMFLNSCGNIECQKKVNILHGEKTNINKYGVSNPAKSNIIKEKTKQTNLKKYGYKCVLQNNIIKEKTKQTNLKKYGNEYSQRSLIVKEKIKKSNINTCLSKYYVSNISKLNEITKKKYNTMKNNNSFNISKPENESYNLLKTKYYNVIRQYKSNLYPFICDFYIPNLDLYIECNYHWTHGKFQYIENDQKCKDKLNKWKCKNTKYYNNAIETWTIRDVNKRNIAKENNLNWVEFFDINELKEWIEQN